MTRLMLIDAVHPEETRVVITRDGMVEEFDFASATKSQVKGNIYLAKVTRVEPSLQAAFVEYGGDKQGFLPFSEIHPDYYQIPLADRQRLLEEAAANFAREEAEELAAEEARERGEAPAKSSRKVQYGENWDEQSQDESGEHKDGYNASGYADDANGSANEVIAESEENIEKEAGVIPEISPVEVAPVVALGIPQAIQQVIQQVAQQAAQQAELQAIAVEVVPEPITIIEPTTPVESLTDAENTAANLLPEQALVAEQALVVSEDGNPTEDSSEDAAGDNSEAADNNQTDGDRQRRRRRRRPFGTRSKDNRDARPQVAEKISPTDKARDNDGNEEGGRGDIETISGDDDDEQRGNAHSAFMHRYKIQEVIKRNQILLVQVIKDERGNKGVSLTTYVSLAGRYCVLMPNASKDGGISRKIGRGDERKRLRELSQELKESGGMSAIIRTAGVDRANAEIKRDYDYLINLWNCIREDALAANAPALIYEESDLIKRAIRDCYNPDIDAIHVQGEVAFKDSKEFMKIIMPSHAPRVKQYKGNIPIFHEFNVEDQLTAMMKPTARLRSGGYVVINPTEALISIDVNSGRSTTERNVEETALKTNLEAAEEIARQLRLRDLGGLIVVDFIDMFYGKHRRMVERTFKDALKVDRAKIQVGHISPFGLLEMSRQRLRPSISETINMTCSHCQGMGIVRSPNSLAIEVIRVLEKEASSGRFGEICVSSNQDLALHLLNFSRSHLEAIEQAHKLKITIKIQSNIQNGVYAIEKIKAQDARDFEPREPREPREEKVREERQPNDNRRPPRQKQEAVSPSATAIVEDGAENLQSEEGSEATDGEKRRRPRRRGGRGRNRRNDGTINESGENSAENGEFNNQDGADDFAENSENNASFPVNVTPLVAEANILAATPAIAEAIPSKPARRSPVRKAATQVVEEKAPAAIIIEDSSVGSGDDEKPQSSRKGWWRRIVE